MLIISRGGRSARVEKQAFPDEDALQRYISENPEAIPLDELGEDASLHVLGREFPTASGPVDVLATDSAGNAYLIETKLFKNPDKRQVLAQVLDYAAALWSAELSTEDLIAGLREDASRRKAPDPVARLTEYLDGDDEAVSEHLERVAHAVADGRFTAIVLMDRLDDRLRTLIRFMNEHSRFRLLAVELDYYRFEDSEIVSPRVFGAEARQKSARSGDRRASWSEDEFFARFTERCDPATVAAGRKLYDFAAPLGSIGWGSGGANPSMIPYCLPGFNKAPFVLSSIGNLDCKLGWVRNAPKGVEFIAAALPRLTALGLPIDPAKLRKRWPAELWVPKVDGVIAAFKAALAAVE